MFLLFINTHFRLTYAGFFAKSQIMFFLSSSFRFCQPLKNDGRDELRFREVVNDFLYKRKNRECKPSPLVGEGVSGADGRGNLEQIPKRVPYGKTLNTCLSFLNKVMASEPIFEERSDAVKVSETLCLG